MLGKLEQYIGGAWLDMSSRVSWLDSPVSISRGVSEDGTPQAGTMTVVIENSDGALTPGKAPSEVRRNLAPVPRADASWGVSYATGGAGTSTLVTDARWQGGVARRAQVTTVPSSGNPYIRTSAALLPILAVGETWTIAFRYALSGGGTINNVWVGGSNAPVVTYGLLQTIDNGDGTFTAWRTATCTSLGAGDGSFQAYISLNSVGLTTSTDFWAGDLLCEKTDIYGGYFDGGFTPDGGTAPSWTAAANGSASVLTTVGASLVRWRPIRLSAWANGAWRPRFYGYVDSESLSWPTGVAEYCVVTVTAIDVIGRLSAGSLRGISAEVVLATSPIAYWPLTESGANLSGVSWADLAEVVVGEGGELSYGAGKKLPADTAGALVAKPADVDNWTFAQSPDFSLPATWSLSVYFTPSADGDFGSIVEVGTDDRWVAIYWDPAVRKCKAYVWHSDPAVGLQSIAIGESSSAIPVGSLVRETLTYSGGGTYKLGSASSSVTATIVWSSEAAELPSTVQASVAGGSQSSGWVTPLTGEVSHVAIWSGALPSLPTGLLPSASTIEAWVSQLAAWAGVPLVSVTTRGTDRTVVTPEISGSSAAAVLGVLAQGSLSRIAADTAGGLVVTSWDYLPAPIAMPSGEIDPGVTWAAEPDGSPTLVLVTWPDGSTYRAVQSLERPVDLPGVLPAVAGASVAEWLTRVDQAPPRIPDAAYDLVSLPDATQATLCGLTIGDRLSIGMLPPQLPGPGPYPSQVSIVDAITETIGADQWAVGLQTSPEVRGNLFIAQNPVAGMLNAGFVAAPFGPEVNGGPWKPGEEVTAFRLNLRHYGGPDCQTGSANVTPVANVDTSLAVTFPTAFSSAPKVILTPNVTTPFTQLVGISVASVTSTGFVIWVRRTNSTGFPVRWVAVL